MTRKEQIEQAAYAPEHRHCTYVNGDVMSFIEGAEWADKTMIEKALKWLKEQEEMVGISFQEDFIERFKQAMEE